SGSCSSRPVRRPCGCTTLLRMLGLTRQYRGSRANWSHHSNYLYFDSREHEPWLCRFQVADTMLQRIVSLKGVRRAGHPVWPWMGLTPDDSPLSLRDTGTQEIYALDWDAP